MAAVWPLGLAGDADAGFGFRVWQPRATPAKTCDAAYLGAEGSMTIPQWALLGFGCLDAACALWNRRCLSMVEDLTGRVRISEWQADLPQGGDWYRRAGEGSHELCREPTGLCRDCPLHHGSRCGQPPPRPAGRGHSGRADLSDDRPFAFAPSDIAASICFAFFFVQAICMFSMAVAVAVAAVG